MKKTTKNIIALPLLALTFLPALTNAANVDLNMNVGVNMKSEERGRPEGDGRPENRPGNMRHMGTSTRDWNNGTSSRPMIGGKSIGGLISAISESSFTIESPSKNGTTTTTVNTDATTVFRSGTSTVALTSLTVGQRVSVRGDFSTSTNSIAAKQVNVLLNMKNKDNGMGNKQGFMGKFFGWLKKLF